jgi:hypothetical protein
MIRLRRITGLGLGFGWQDGWSHPGHRRPSPPLWPLPLVHWWRGKGTPSPLYKGAPGGDAYNNTSTSLGTLPPLWCTAHLHLSLISLLLGLLKGCLEARLHHRCMSSCCGVSRSRPKRFTSAISAGSEIPGVIVIIVRV